MEGISSENEKARVYVKKIDQILEEHRKNKIITRLKRKEKLNLGKKKQKLSENTSLNAVITKPVKKHKTNPSKQGLTIKRKLQLMTISDSSSQGEKLQSPKSPAGCVPIYCDEIKTKKTNNFRPSLSSKGCHTFNINSFFLKYDADTNQNKLLSNDLNDGLSCKRSRNTKSISIKKQNSDYKLEVHSVSSDDNFDSVMSNELSSPKECQDDWIRNAKHIWDTSSEKVSDGHTSSHKVSDTTKQDSDVFYVGSDSPSNVDVCNIGISDQIETETLSEDVTSATHSQVHQLSEKNSNLENENVISETIPCLPLSPEKISNFNNKNVIYEDNSYSQSPKKISNFENENVTSEATSYVLDKQSGVQLHNSGKKVDKVTYLDLSDCTLVVLPGDITISIHGMIALSVLRGKIEVLGHTMDCYSSEVRLYSPRGGSLFYLKNIADNQFENREIEIPEKYAATIGSLNLVPTTSIVVCKKIHELFMKFVEKHISQQILPKNETNSSQCVFQPYTKGESKGASNVINISAKWDKIVDSVGVTTKMMLCGGKGVGKSTCLRYAVNKLLQRYNQVRVVDLDPGQSEFTVPGCISIVTVKTPLLGPNYTHIQDTDYSVLSDISAGYDPKQYVDSIKHLMSKYANTSDMPTLINYIGFNRGIGLNIVSAAIQIVRPTDVVMIQSEKLQSNYKVALSPYVVNREAELFLEEISEVTYNLHMIKSMYKNNESSWTLLPRQTREMCLFAYLGRMMSVTENSLLSPHIPTYETDLTCIKLVDTRGRETSPMAVNANVVTLCSSYCDEKFAVCGWGIVRGIDLEKNILILLTPLEQHVLETVCYLVVGNVTLPPSLLMTTDHVLGLVPYIHEGELPGQVTKRSYLPPPNKR